MNEEDKLRDTINALRRDRDSHLVDEPDYVNSIMRLIYAARFDERMSTLATKDGLIWYVDGAHNIQSSDHERIVELQRVIKSLSK